MPLIICRHEIYNATDINKRFCYFPPPNVCSSCHAHKIIYCGDDGVLSYFFQDSRYLSYVNIQVASARKIKLSINSGLIKRNYDLGI